jgi:hypothetical protein
MTQGSTDARREYFGAAAVYAAGAVLYFVAREFLALDFLVSPLFYGVVVLIASYFRPRLLASAVILTAWGIAVLLDGRGPVAEGRTAPVHLAGFGVGALLCLLLRRWIDARVALESIAIIMIVAGLWYYFAFEFSALQEAWLWSAVFLASAAMLVLWGIRLRSTGAAGRRAPSPRTG